MKRSLWLISYDISHQKRRKKVFRLLKSYGKSAQFSVFECYLSHAQVNTIQLALEKIIDQEADRVHCYPLCSQCSLHIRVLGQAKRVEPLPLAWIISDSDEDM